MPASCERGLKHCNIYISILKGINFFDSPGIQVRTKAENDANCRANYNLTLINLICFQLWRTWYYLQSYNEIRFKSHENLFYDPTLSKSIQVQTIYLQKNEIYMRSSSNFSRTVHWKIITRALAYNEVDPTISVYLIIPCAHRKFIVSALVDLPMRQRSVI